MPVTSAKSALCVLVQGVGQAGISHVVLTDGHTRLADARFRGIVLLGMKAPRKGLPDPRRRTKPVSLKFA